MCRNNQLVEYIDQRIAQICKKCGCKRDIDYDIYCIGNYALVAISANQRDVQAKLIRDLYNRLPKQFGYSVQIVKPRWFMYDIDPRGMDMFYYSQNFEVSGNIYDISKSVGYWEIFKFPHVIMPCASVCTSCPDTIVQDAYMKILSMHGYDATDIPYEFSGDGWIHKFKDRYDNYCSAYTRAFGISPERRGIELATSIEHRGITKSILACNQISWF